MTGAKEFKNIYYLPEWEEKTPQGRFYAVGTASKLANGGLAVYDGAENYMGLIRPDGCFEYSGDPTPYKESFLRSAAEEFAGACQNE